MEIDTQNQIFLKSMKMKMSILSEMAKIDFKEEEETPEEVVKALSGEAFNKEEEVTTTLKQAIHTLQAPMPEVTPIEETQAKEEPKGEVLTKLKQNGVTSMKSQVITQETATQIKKEIRKSKLPKTTQ